ncbi:MAG: O-antigen ligase family protein [Scytonematopsis contorta HA4267-MV1]|nr:O-antigen ligase family protein [Scytonematopsis contorta HA4267-MV1]
MKTKLAERFWAVILLLVTAGALKITPPQEISPNPIGGASVELYLNILSYIILFCLMLSHWKGFLFVGTRSKSQLILFTIVLFSVFWSVDVGSTLIYLRGLIRIYLVAIYLAMRYTLREQMRLAAWALGIATVLSMIVPLTIPGFGIHTAPELKGMWTGIYGHKNQLGYMMAWSAGLFLHLGLSANRYRWLMWVLLGISVQLILLSRSTTSLMILCTMGCLLPIYNFVKKTNYKLQIILITFALMILIGGAILVVSNAETIIGASGKDMTFNGRTDLWEYVNIAISEKPWLGYGYYAFWDSIFAIKVRSLYTWASNAHNGFLELLLDLGWVGFSCFLVGLVRFFVMAINRIVTVAKRTEDYWPMQMLVIILILNFSEARLLNPSWNWLMYLTTALSLTVNSHMNKKQAWLKEVTNG